MSTVRTVTVLYGDLLKMQKSFSFSGARSIILMIGKGRSRAMKQSLKYEQIMNMPKNRRKRLVIRIFRQIPAKVRMETQCFQGVPGGTVEMKEARLGR